MSCCSSTICWKTYLCSIILPLLLYERSLACIYVGRLWALCSVPVELSVCSFTDFLHLICSLVPDINFKEISQSLVLKYCFCSFVSYFALCYSCYVYDTTFIVVPQFLDILFFLSSFSSLLSFRSFCCRVLKLRDRLLGCFQSTVNPSDAFFVSVTVVLVSSISRSFFLRIYTSLFTLSTCACMFSTFPFNPLIY